MKGEMTMDEDKALCWIVGMICAVMFGCVVAYNVRVAVVDASVGRAAVQAGLVQGSRGHWIERSERVGTVGQGGKE